jgi:hypothetical protein
MEMRRMRRDVFQVEADSHDAEPDDDLAELKWVDHRTWKIS